jgi:hypothetical protein
VLYVPAGQGCDFMTAKDVLLAGHVKPATHNAHCPAPVSLYRPDAHGVHVAVVYPPGLAVPAAHSICKDNGT